MKTQISVIPPIPESAHTTSKDNNAINPFKNLFSSSDELIEPKYNSYVEYILS